MTENQLAAVLERMYDDAERRGESVTTAIHLFGLLYAEDIQDCKDRDPGAGRRMMARIGRKKSVAINDMRRLSRYVTVKNAAELRRRFA